MVLVAGPMVVSFYLQASTILIPLFGEAFGRTPICMRIPAPRPAGWSSSRGLHDSKLAGGAHKGSPSRMSGRQPRLEHMFVQEKMRAAGQPHRGLGHVGLRTE